MTSLVSGLHCIDPFLPTLRKLGWVVVDVGQSDVDRGGAREASDLPCHVFGLDNNRVVFSGFAVHVS